MVGWHHRLGGQESERTPGGSVGQELGVLQSLGLQRSGTHSGTEQQPLPCPGWGFKSSEEGLCHTSIRHLPGPEFDPPTENHLEGSASRSGGGGGGAVPPGEQPCTSPMIRPEAVIHVSVNRLDCPEGVC